MERRRWSNVMILLPSVLRPHRFPCVLPLAALAVTTVFLTVATGALAQGRYRSPDKAIAAPKARPNSRPRKCLAIHAAELAIEPNFQILRRHHRSLLLRLEHAHRSAMENYVHRAPRLGSRRSLNLRIGMSTRI